LNDLTRRADLRAVGKRTLESLIKVGALDRFGPRLSLLQNLERIVAASASHFRALEAGQMSLFGGPASVSEDFHLPPPVGDVDQRELLNWERELIGLYLSDHPLNAIQSMLAKLVSYFSGQLGEARHEEKVRVAGLVAATRPYQTKKGSMMGFVTLEDIQGNIELVLFPKVWQECSGLVEIGKVVLVEGKVDANSSPPKILVDVIKTEMNIVEAAEFAPLPVRPAGGSRERPAPALQPAQVRRVAQPVPVYAAAEDAPVLEWNDDDGPPPPEAFPPGWDMWESAGEETPVYTAPAQGPEVEPLAVVPSQEPPARVLLPPMLPPMSARDVDENQPPRLLTIILRPNGNPERDRRRIKALIGILISHPGRDHFEMQIFESGRGHLIDFPNDTTHICPALLERLKKLLGEETWRIEPITLQ
jgi:DNA polymerase-3 subunit alpha